MAAEDGEHPMGASRATLLRHGGNLRLFAVAPPWQADYADTLGPLAIFGENAFGTQYCRDPDGLVALLDPESRDIQETGVSESAFLALIDSDPDWAIDQGLFEACCAEHGPVGESEHFHYVHPLALGGAQEVGNVRRLPAIERMAFLAAISRQIQDTPPGTQFHPVFLAS